MHFLMPTVFSSHSDFREWFSNPLTGMVEGSQEYSESIVKRLHQVQLCELHNLCMHCFKYSVYVFKKLFTGVATIFVTSAEDGSREADAQKI